MGPGRASPRHSLWLWERDMTRDTGANLGEIAGCLGRGGTVGGFVECNAPVAKHQTAEIKVTVKKRNSQDSVHLWKLKKKERGENSHHQLQHHHHKPRKQRTCCQLDHDNDHHQKENYRLRYAHYVFSLTKKYWNPAWGLVYVCSCLLHMHIARTKEVFKNDHRISWI